MNDETVILNLTPAKNTINRDHAEMQRIARMFKRAQITKAQAIDLFQDYMLQTRGVCAKWNKFNYKRAA